MRVNRTAVENAEEFDRRKGGRTMPADVVPVFYRFKRKKPKAQGRKVLRDRTLRVILED